MRYYRIDGHVGDRIPNRWYLGIPLFNGKMAVWDFFKSEEIHFENEKPIQVQIVKKGKQLDITFSQLNLIIGSERFISLFDKNQFQSIPIKVDSINSPYFLIQIKNKVDCVDEVTSNFLKWIPEDNRPDKTGKYRSITSLYIDSYKIPKTLHIFRLSGYDVEVIVSEYFKNIIEQNNISGLNFNEVTTADPLIIK